MRRLLLSAALMCGGASAVNLAEMNAKDTCFTGTLQTRRISDFGDEDLFDRKIILKQAINRIVPLGIRVVDFGDTTCMYNLTPFFYYYVSPNKKDEYDIFLTLEVLVSTMHVDWGNGSNSYLLHYGATTPFFLDEPSDYTFDSLVSLFIKDWKAVHP